MAAGRELSLYYVVCCMMQHTITTILLYPLMSLIIPEKKTGCIHYNPLQIGATRYKDDPDGSPPDFVVDIISGGARRQINAKPFSLRFYFGYILFFHFYKFSV